MVPAGQFLRRFLVSNQTRLLCIVGVTLLGLYSKFYRGWYAAWINNSIGGVLYVVFWCGLFDLILSQRTPKGIAIGVLLVTSLLEIMQLSRHASLEYVRSFFWGRTLIGTTFAATDFVYYIIGSFLGYFWICWIRRRGAKIY